MVKEIIIGTDLIDDIQKYDVVLVGMSTKNSKGNGFQYKVCRNFPDVDKANKETNYDDANKLGTCQVVGSYKDKNFPIFVICYITKGRYRPDIQPDALDYEALKSCLSLVNSHFMGAKVATTLMGNSIYEGGGDAKKIYEIIGETCEDIDLYIYDYEQKSYMVEDNENFFAIVNAFHNKEISKEEYQEKKRKFLWEKAFGKYLMPLPEGLSEYETRKQIKLIKEQQQI